MKFDIQVNLQLEADNELEAEQLITDIMNETVALENKLTGWDFIEYIEEDIQDVPWN